MARYDRTFLVPYLNDICTLHLSKKKVNDKIEEERRKIERIKENAIKKVPEPEMERIKKDEPTVGAILLAMALIAISPVMMIMTLWEGVAYAIIGLGCLGGGYAVGICSYRNQKKENVSARRRNAEREQQYQQDKDAAVNGVAPIIREIERRIEFYVDEIEQMDALLTDLYSAKVISRKYRDLYPAVYLDDWFSNSHSDDLDIAVNTLVLEQIKDKLDVIIKNQGEELINQRIMIANQVKTMEQQERHHQALMSKLDEMQVTNEERNSYLQMINANTATSAFFARASYLRS